MLNTVRYSSIFDRDQRELCIKCDSPLFEQGEGTVLRADIAHQRETVEQALTKLEDTLERCWQGSESRVRLIVGGGRIRDAVLGQLWYLHSRGLILDYREEDSNPGAVLVMVR